ncbi:MAG: 4-(cytidine 5'-diphospho)-2-C-methyl-D-erythritol kinase [Xanthomonadales bacterium]|nr:4-(cytidine 5'-diphospho)-2-C-methyl-D-erythritol kinase [Xanthomonadales bacterium]
MSESRWPAPAKINLFLHILGRDESGYHRLQTLFQLLDWGDEIRIEPTDESDLVLLRPTPGVPTDQDLGLRAARLLQDETGVRLGAKISVTKRIPLGAGLGGGSSDAATVLHALNCLWDAGLSVTDLAALGRRLGADVPVFVHGASAWAEGRGELLTPMSVGESWYVLGFPGTHVSTAAVFNAPDLPRNSPAIDPSDYAWERCRNDCQAWVLDHHPGLEDWLAGLAEFGAPRMSGTGSCFYLRARDSDVAHEITQALKSRYNVRAVRGVDTSPLLETCAEAR